MESLYRKYRPQTFADVVGQQHVVGTLERAVLEGRTSHAYLFCGPRGTGKTTMARLLAKALMCEKGPGQLPDGTCVQCSLIAAGEHPDVYELDAASRTGVESVREEIINSVNYAPTRGRYKVYIIDEVHMLSTAAFNALLKTLEEPPGHVVFVLCTTDPQKVPATILSRVQRFGFRPIADADIQAHLVHVCEEEGFTYEDAALELITRNARGGMRDALSSLEQLSVFGGGIIGLDAAQDLLGVVSGTALSEVVDAMARRDVSALFVRVGELVTAGSDLLQFTRELAAHLRDVYVVTVAGANPAVLPANSDVARLQTEAAAFGSSDRLARILTLLGDVSREMTTAPNQRLVLEIAFTKIARPESDLTLESLAERMAALEQALAHGEKIAVAQSSVPTAAAQPAPAPQSNRQPAVQPMPNSAPAPQRAPQPAATPAPQRQQSASTPGPAQRPQPQPAPSSRPAPAPQRTQRPKPAPAATTQPKSSPQSAAVQDPGALQRSWRKVVSEMMARVPARGTLLSNAVPVSDDGQKLVVNLPKGSGFALKMLERPDVRGIVDGVVANVFGPRTLEFKEGTGTDLRVPTQQRQQRPSQQPAPAAAPQPAPRSAPIQQAVPVQQPAPQPAPAPAPAPQPQAAPAPAEDAGYPMPWDEAPAAQAPAYDAPPLDDDAYFESAPYDDFGGYGEPEPAPAPVPAPIPAPQPAPAPQPVPAPQPKPEPKPAPTPEPAAPVAAFGESVPEAEASSDDTGQPEVPTDLPPELVAVLENAFEVFGSNVRVSRK